jgi:hypothetical protein
MIRRYAAATDETLRRAAEALTKTGTAPEPFTSTSTQGVGKATHT